MSLSLSEMTLGQAFFEVRYPQAFTMWDRSGQLWSRAIEKWPDLKSFEAQPDKVRCTLKDRFRLVVEMKQSGVQDYLPDRPLNELKKMACEFKAFVEEILEIKSYTRVALRLIYLKEYPTAEAAAETVEGLKFINIPKGPHFEIDKSPIHYDCVIRFEDNEIGTILRLQTSKQEVTVETPFRAKWMKIPPLEAERYILAYDIDYFTLKRVEVGKLDVEEWIKHAFHVIKRDSNALLGA